ncbi:carboxypeptidase regulatory-like domain-containing protein [Alienimonas sp. DA493]|uniref:carboxypeptidase regulatory-like domain-containing protein n=1 Tax=Alienimonas sp. DA493 TaxID=3373605 RepID=UPI0037546F9E
MTVRLAPRPPHLLSRFSLLTACAVVLAAGCDRPSADYDGLQLADVSGVVTIDGEPLPGAVVRFYKAGDRVRYAYGETDAEGRYSLRYNSEAEGVSPGKKDVVISTALSGPEVQRKAGPERVPARYNRDTELTRTVERDGSHTFDFALTSDGEIAEPRAGDEEENENAPGEG